ncbi:hypothetical protein DFH09DRAFT_234543 [Mycena vulgaris]|nr:hypothetical protein DFH09DRAFT_234543 [Mycena vulgaris]
MEQEFNPPVWYGEPPLVPSPSMFQNATRFGIERSQFMNVQGNMNINPILSPAIPRGQGPESTGIIEAIATGTGNITSPSRDITGSVYTESGSYCSQLLRQGRGFPLYVPGPQMNLPAEYRRRGVAIGDVGRVTAEGVFDFFFNIYCASDHPINAHTPEDFVPLAAYDPIDVVRPDFDAGNYVSTPSVHELNRGRSEPFPGSEFVFSSGGPNGAVLALPHGAHLEKLENLESVRRYAAKHAESWYNYVNGTRGRGLVNGSLYLVTGCEKTKSWGMASFHDVADQNEFELAFKPSADADSGHKYRWQRGTPARYKHADPPPVDGTPLNQTTFIHAFTISLGEGIWGKVFGEVEICQLVDSQLARSAPGFVPYSSQRSTSLWSLSLFGGSAGAGGNGRNNVHGNVVISDVAPIPMIVYPSQILNDHILREFPTATVVVTHDGDWSGILHDIRANSVHFFLSVISFPLQGRHRIRNTR